MASIYEQSRSFRAQLLERDRAAAARLTDAYARAWKAIKKQLDGLTKQIAEAQQNGQEINQAWLYRQDRYLALLRQVGEQLGKFAEIAGKQITTEQRKSIQAGRTDTESLLTAGAQEAGIEASFARVPQSAFENMIGFLGNGSPLKDLLDELPRRGGVIVAQGLADGIAKGTSVSTIARQIRLGLNGSLARALRIARTETLRAYREASHQTYEQNSDVLDGWVWLSALQSRCCAACIVLHGSFHPVSERMKSHIACRCTQVPAVQGADLQIEKGSEWFARQPAKVQQEIFDQDSKYQAYRSGELKLEDFVGLRRNSDWGDSYEVLSLDRARIGEGQFPTEQERPRSQPIESTPASEPRPNGKPVSDALKIPKKGNLAAVGQKVLNIISALHGDGNLPLIEVKQNTSKTANGTYHWHFGPLRPGMIKISSGGDHPELTLAHEIGHFLDHQGIGNPRNMETTDGTLFADFFKATQESEAINRLRDQLTQGYYEYHREGGKVVTQAVNHEYLRYLLTKQETWARAYAQWVAHRSQDPVLIEQLRKLRENEHPGSANSQWADDDFEPIAKTIDTLMEKLEWRIP